MIYFKLAGKLIDPSSAQVVSHAEVLAIGQQKADLMKKLVEKIVVLIPSAPELQ